MEEEEIHLTRLPAFVGEDALLGSQETALLTTVDADLKAEQTAAFGV